MLLLWQKSSHIKWLFLLVTMGAWRSGAFFFFPSLIIFAPLKHIRHYYNHVLIVSVIIDWAVGCLLFIALDWDRIHIANLISRNGLDFFCFFDWRKANIARILLPVRYSLRCLLVDRLQSNCVRLLLMISHLVLSRLNEWLLVLVGLLTFLSWNVAVRVLTIFMEEFLLVRTVKTWNLLVLESEEISLRIKPSVRHRLVFWLLTSLGEITPIALIIKCLTHWVVYWLVLILTDRLFYVKFVVRTGQSLVKVETTVFGARCYSKLVYLLLIRPRWKLIFFFNSVYPWSHYIKR